MVNVYKLSQSKKIPLDFRINESGCFEITSHKLITGGYAFLRRYKKRIFAHRFVYEEMFGDIPKGLVVRHKCDNPSCINPEHLELGTQTDNMKDMYLRGRNNAPRGTENYRSKLTEQDVKEIRKLIGSLSHKKIGEKYGVSSGTIGAIAVGRTWSHVS